MNILATVAGFLLLVNIPASKENREGPPRIKIKVKGVDSASKRGALEKNLKTLASTDDVLVGKDGTITILMKRSDKAHTLRLSEIVGAIKRTSDEISIDNRKTELDGKFHIETNARAKGILEKIKAQKGIKRVGKGERLGRTLSFEVEASGLNLGSLMRAVGQEKIDLIWTSPAKKKTGGGG
jgi:hypothetical protein